MYKVSSLTRTAAREKATSATLLLEGPSIIKAVILAVIGAYFIYAGLIYFGALSVGIAVIIFTRKEGIELALTTRQYRLFTTALGFRVGDWDIIPATQHITMKYFSDLVTSGKPGRIRTDRDKRYIVMFSVSNSSQGSMIYETEKYATALKLTRFLAEALNVDAKLYDKM
ncbi:hypothetical protein HMJ29_00100 [Hymenobacter taeanensis]|uniref:Uncharacterized protein n=1 Tax=Hymenobacter taeanensis TaxID=2735321 RepID=A0A6M6BBT1_9BACT|nr:MULTISPECIES: hypothetical protein [Hymenobacter]QJX45420.1 hypothetical protein HMJ29_00100 [Hymenobacter taeanensis]UOQ81337.1 hypothetical protein MUN83_00610 [Hymenobacter sp. 5414T-23]